MAIHHDLIDPNGLSNEARETLAKAPARAMAARGLAPLARPSDLVTVLYQIAVDPAEDPTLRQHAHTTGFSLPEPILAAALAEPSLDPRVLDFYAAAIAERPELFAPIVLNRGTADETIAALSKVADEGEIELIAQDEQRLLRHTDIIAAMYNNPKARMSTVNRALELAIRNQCVVAGIAAWDELVAALTGHRAGGPQATADATQGVDGDGEKDTALDDDAFAHAIDDGDDGKRPSAGKANGRSGQDKDAKPISEMNIPEKIRAATLGNAFKRSELVRDPVPLVALAAIKSPKVTDAEASKYAGNQALADDVIRYISERRDWTRLYSIKLALVQNPKTPRQTTNRFMTHLREKDLRQIARSKSVPAAVATQARNLLSARKRSSQKNK